MFALRWFATFDTPERWAGLPALQVYGMRTATLCAFMIRSHSCITRAFTRSSLHRSALTQRSCCSSRAGASGYSPSGSGGESASSRSLRSRERRPMVESGLSHSALPLRNNHRRSGESDCGHCLFPRQTRSATLAVSLTIASPDGALGPRKLSGSHQSGKALKAGLPHRVGDMLGILNNAHDDQKFGARRGRDGDGAETE